MNRPPSRREVLAGASVLALFPGACATPRKGTSSSSILLNDVHSKLNPTHVAAVEPVDSLIALRGALRRAREQHLAVSIAGGRHAMGGQQFGAGTLNLDLRPLARVLAFDRERGLLEVEAGIQWPELVAWYQEAQRGEPRQWAIAQKQTGADRLTIGGALAANAHGRGLSMSPFVSDVEAFTLVDASGELRTCSRTQDPELFALVIGGYGLFGVVYSVTLRLAPRRVLERVVEVRSAYGLVDAVEARIAEGYLYGDLQFSIDSESGDFLKKGVFSCYRPVDGATDVPVGNAELADERWAELAYLAHVDEARAWEVYSGYYLTTSGQRYWSDDHQTGFYADDYHAALDQRLGARVPGTEMITELYVPRAELASFLSAASEWLRETRAEVVYGTVRFIEPDAETFLAWARERFVCIVLNLHVDHDEAGLARARTQFRGLIDIARARGGSFFLTYHRWATREQVEACYPQFPEFLRRKLAHDPDERFQSEWYRHMRNLFADVV